LQCSAAQRSSVQCGSVGSPAGRARSCASERSSMVLSCSTAHGAARAAMITLDYALRLTAPLGAPPKTAAVRRDVRMWRCDATLVSAR
jgi:hypothetical protein